MPGDIAGRAEEKFGLLDGAVQLRDEVPAGQASSRQPRRRYACHMT
ncbi:hypothetical protein [Micromonospora sp. NPDC093277]